MIRMAKCLISIVKKESNRLVHLSADAELYCARVSNPLLTANIIYTADLHFLEVISATRQIPGGVRVLDAIE